MDEDYASASARHLRDTESLCVAERWDNVMYLSGYIVECAVKAVIQLAGFRPKLHVDRMSPSVLILAADLGRAARRYAVDLDPDVEFVRDKWTDKYRYVGTGSTSEPDARTLRAAGQRVFQRTVERLVLDGYLDTVPQ